MSGSDLYQAFYSLTSQRSDSPRVEFDQVIEFNRTIDFRQIYGCEGKPYSVEEAQLSKPDHFVRYLITDSSGKYLVTIPNPRLSLCVCNYCLFQLGCRSCQGCLGVSSHDSDGMIRYHRYLAVEQSLLKRGYRVSRASMLFYGRLKLLLVCFLLGLMLIALLL